MLSALLHLYHSVSNMLMYWWDTSTIGLGSTGGICRGRTPLQNNQVTHDTWAMKTNLLYICFTWITAKCSLSPLVYIQLELNQYHVISCFYWHYIESSYYFTHLHEESWLLYKWVFVKHGLYSCWMCGPRPRSFLKYCLLIHSFIHSLLFMT